jgi:hypothetical protein
MRSIYICIHVCMYVCVLYIYVYMYVCMRSIYMYTCMYVCVYVYFDVPCVRIAAASAKRIGLKSRLILGHAQLSQVKQFGFIVC